MGASGSIPSSIDEAYSAGYTQSQIDTYLSKHNKRRTSSFDMSGAYLAKLTPPASPKVGPIDAGCAKFEELKIDDDEKMEMKVDDEDKEGRYRRGLTK